MEQAEITKLLHEQFGEAILLTHAQWGQDAVTIRPESLVDVALFLRDTPGIECNLLSDVGGVDYLDYEGWENEWRYEVAYQFYSIGQNHRYRVRVAVTDDTVEVPSVWEMWRVANWMEREVFDMYGIRFTGHPNLRRILCHDKFEGHALRKDYPINKRQTLSEPTAFLLTDDPEWA